MRARRAVRILFAASLSIALSASAVTSASSSEGRSARSHACAGGARSTPADVVRYDPTEPSARSVGAADAALRAALRAAPAKAPTTTTVDVYAHVLRSESGGGVSQRRVERQIAVLNDAFAGRESAASAATPFR